MEAMNFKKKVAYFLRCSGPKPIFFSELFFYGFFGLLIPAGGPKCAAVLLTAYYFVRNSGLKFRALSSPSTLDMYRIRQALQINDTGTHFGKISRSVASLTVSLSIFDRDFGCRSQSHCDRHPK